MNARLKLFSEIKWLSLLVPALLFYVGLFLLPTLSAVYYSFTDWDGLTGKYIGLDNYIDMFHDKKILTAFNNTAMYTSFTTILQNLLGLIFALLLSKKFTGVNTLRTLFFMPAIFSPLLVGYVWGFILQPNFGALNHALDLLHLSSLKMGWLSDPFWARRMIIAVTVWQFSGYSMVIYIAGLQTISQELYESGKIDGANAWHRFRHITFPLIAPSFTINVILCVIGNLKLFDQIYALTNGGPGYATESVASMIYRIGFGSGVRWGYGCAMSVVLFIGILIVNLVLLSGLRKREVEL
jgi:multiple sugar transport system permease protein/raffinose/stachyose/melibiose transport system permease protein